MKKRILGLTVATLLLFTVSVSAIRIHQDVWDWDGTMRWTLSTNDPYTSASSKLTGYGRRKSAYLELRNDMHSIVHSGWTPYASAKTLFAEKTSGMSPSYYVYGDYATLP